MIETLVRRWVPLAAIGVVMAALVRQQHAPPAGSDTYLHLRFGSEFLAEWSLQSPGHLGPFDSAEWLPTQWLAQVAMAAVEGIGGLAAVMWLAGTVILVVPLLAYVVCRHTTTPLAASIAAVLACIAAQPGLSGRPQVLSYLLVLVVTSAWLATARDGRPRFWLILVGWLWVPLHGMWPIGIVIGAVAVMGIALQRTVPGRRILTLAAIPVASGLVALITPLGAGALTSVVTVGSRSEYFAEWGPTDFTSPYAVVLLAVLGIAFAGNLRTGPTPWPTLLLLGLALTWAVYSARTTPVAALMAAPLAAEVIQRHLPEASPMARLERSALAVMLVLATAILGPVVVSRADERVVPSWLDQRLDSLEPGTRVLNDWDEGPYFLWRHPQLALTMHGYGDVFTDEELARNRDILRLRPGWDSKVADLNADVALVDPDSPLGYALEHDLRWTLVESDDEFALLSPPPDD